MKNGSTEHNKEIKKWLDIDTYRKFEELPLIQLCHKLLAIKPWHKEFEAKAVSLYIGRLFTENPFLITEKHLGYLTADDLSTSPDTSF